MWESCLRWYRHSLNYPRGGIPRLQPWEEVKAARRGQTLEAVEPVALEEAVRDCRGNVETNGAALEVRTDAAETAEAHGRELNRSESADGGARLEITGVERV